ncbi:MAG: DUF4056 domain-containing protein [Prolixibacteraceae bacterium]|jgi:hypothetical protein|nr:DUF4056 domain-containing protein [Prolixibacteraceae bacterium]
MISFKKIFILLLILQTGGAMAKSIDISPGELKCPPRIIRTCCAFGYDIKYWGVPFISNSEIIAVDKLGQHQYLGGKNEGNGIIYTLRGGFIDVGHMRDQADWTVFLYEKIKDARGGKETLKLGYEAGVKKLLLNIPDSLSDDDILRLAGYITYHLSLWHEIATWYGASTVPLLPERYSAFSVEDDFSNRLGVELGARAVKSSLPFGEAMELEIRAMLDTLQAVETEQETIAAMESVHNSWWTREKKLPSAKVLLQYSVPDYGIVRPMLVPMYNFEKPYEIELAFKTSRKVCLDEYFSLRMRLNGKVPWRKIFPTRKRRIITQADFIVLLEAVKKDIQNNN